jgi:GAF domain-containing protein
MDYGNLVQFDVPDLEGLTSIEKEFVVVTADGSEEERLEALTRLLHKVREALHMDVVFVSEFTHGRRVFRHVDAAPGEPDHVTVGGSDPLEESFCLRVVDGRLPRAIRNARANPKAAHLPATQQIGIGAHLSVPVVLRDGRVYGTLCCFSHRSQPGLGDREVEALQSVARLVAVTIERQGHH